jgi:DNA modification methylase
MNRIEFGDCRDTMRRWAADGVKVQTCVTSPPYFGLRDYGHEGQIGLEPTPEAYIAAMVEVFRCVRDVLADDGTLWLNIADSYAGGGGFSPNSPSNQAGSKQTTHKGSIRGAIKPQGEVKAKDLIGIPWMLAFALRADGWYLRQDIIWHKPNPMPESVRDRCTKAHEYIFLLSKSQKYYFDNTAIMEPAIYGQQHANKATSWGTDRKHPNKANTSDYAFKGDNSTCYKDEDGNYMKNRRSVWTVTTKPYKGAHFATFPPDLIEPCILAGARKDDIVLDPFMGSGTTAQVAVQHGRQYLGCELNEKYEELQKNRLKDLQYDLIGAIHA